MENYVKLDRLPVVFELDLAPFCLTDVDKMKQLILDEINAQKKMAYIEGYEESESLHENDPFPINREELIDLCEDAINRIEDIKTELYE
jgi:hypothetical protein